ncbi:hypothetical protein HYH03_016043 [Edaphochlamys debaryana]|uniref:PsbP C-terminal domain-containing protein n=1 Tax=Edaphochlamys debaryana TaxID=47281 RepID=A0A835XL49_9CHLO|nr:hypothetical protein HYH03_016043 [Edaphochlamys debaryana]|eukprot:KAG2485257.1 hypothetical protein HYH03_016043 [Edaphochlamys debaryana]
MAALTAKAFAAAPVAKPASRRSSVVVRAQAPQDVSRRAALAGLAGAAALVSSNVAPAFAASGESANIWGKVTNKSGFIGYVGDGFTVQLPAKWNPSKEREFAGTILRYQDNAYDANHMIVLANPTDKKSIEDFGSPEKFLEQYSFLLGKSAYSGETQSEGGFAPNKVAVAALLEAETATDKKGKKYYRIEVLTRTADGDEGGHHQVFSAAVGSDNKLYIAKVQVGDKRWYKSEEKNARGIVESFTVA